MNIKFLKNNAQQQEDLLIIGITLNCFIVVEILMCSNCGWWIIEHLQLFTFNYTHIHSMRSDLNKN